MRNLILLSFLSQASGFLLHYLTLFILVRFLSVADYGYYQQFSLLLTTVLPFLGFTLVSSLYYFHVRANEHDRRGVVVQTYFLLLTSGASFFLLLTFLKDQLLGVLHLGGLEMLPNWIYLIIPFQLVASLTENIFLLDKRKKFLLFYLPAEKLFHLLAVLCFYFYYRTLEGSLYGYFAFSLLRFIFVTVYVERTCGFRPFTGRFRYLGDQVRYCMPFYVATVAYTLSVKFDKIYVNRYISPAEYAIYSVSFISIPLLSNAFNAINNVAMTEITSLMGAAHHEKVRDLYQNIVSKTSALALPFVIFFFINSREVIVLLFTEKYSDASGYYRIYLLSFLVSLTSYGLILRAASKTRQIFAINVCSSLVSVVFGYFLIREYGMTGAIMTAVIAMWLPGFCQLFAEIRLLGFRFHEFFPLRSVLRIFFASLAGVPFILMCSWITEPGVLYLVLSGLLYFSSVAAALYALKLLPFQDKIASVSLILKKRLQ